MTRIEPILTGLLLVGATLACADDGGNTELGAETSTSGDGDGDPTGDGDGDPSGDGDGDPTTGDGDGDGDPATGDGDGDADPTGDGDGDGDPNCVYPDAAEPMALDEPIAAYAWPSAIHADGTVTPLDLYDAYCDSDQVIDWSPHDILVFISVPAW